MNGSWGGVEWVGKALEEWKESIGVFWFKKDIKGYKVLVMQDGKIVKSNAQHSDYKL